MATANAHLEHALLAMRLGENVEDVLVSLRCFVAEVELAQARGLPSANEDSMLSSLRLYAKAAETLLNLPRQQQTAP